MSRDSPAAARPAGVESASRGQPPRPGANRDRHRRRLLGRRALRGQISVVANRALAAGLDPTTDGWVTFNSSLGADNLSAPPATYTACTISLAHWKWASRGDMESDWGMFCLTVIHEMGHLLGHRHSLAPGSVMAPVFTSSANVPSVCKRTWLKGWR